LEVQTGKIILWMKVQALDSMMISTRKHLGRVELQCKSKGDPKNRKQMGCLVQDLMSKTRIMLGIELLLIRWGRREEKMGGVKKLGRYQDLEIMKNLEIKEWVKLGHSSRFKGNQRGKMTRLVQDLELMMDHR
jgi:hypothetical protein